MPAVARAFLAVLAALAARAQCPQLSSPPAGARPDSAYIAVEGAAAPSSNISFADNGAPLAPLHADSSGRFERVVHLAAGEHKLNVEVAGCAPVRVTLTIGAYPPPPAGAPFEQMRAADIILAHSHESQQYAIYEPIYTHSALYIGPAPNGAARILEAVAEEYATARGPVAAVPIEESFAFRYAARIDLFRLKAALHAADRARIVAWSRRVASQGLPFWTNQDFGDVYRAWLLWDPRTDQPRDAEAFRQLIHAMRARLEATNAFDCATLVWHAYRDNTEERIDLAAPNRVQWGGVAKSAPPRLVETLRPWLIVPDSFALSGKLEQVRGQ